VISHGRRNILHFNVTEHPTAAWIMQQLREAFPEDRALRYLILDRDSKFKGEVATMLKDLGSELIRTTYRRWDEKVDFLDHGLALSYPDLRTRKCNLIVEENRPWKRIASATRKTKPTKGGSTLSWYQA